MSSTPSRDSFITQKKLLFLFFNFEPTPPPSFPKNKQNKITAENICIQSVWFEISSDINTSCTKHSFKPHV